MQVPWTDGCDARYFDLDVTYLNLNLGRCNCTQTWEEVLRLSSFFEGKDSKINKESRFTRSWRRLGLVRYWFLDQWILMMNCDHEMRDCRPHTYKS